jgi:hypothetical protein
MKRVSRWGSWITVASYVLCLLLIGAGAGSPQVGAIGVIGWLLVMTFALLNLVVGALALAIDRREARGTAAVAVGVFAVGVTVSALLISAIPNQN